MNSRVNLRLHVVKTKGNIERYPPDGWKGRVSLRYRIFLFISRLASSMQFEKHTLPSATDPADFQACVSSRVHLFVPEDNSGREKVKTIVALT